MRINRHALEAFRQRSGLSVTQLAEAAGRDQSHLSHILAGRKDPSETTATAMAQALGIDVAAIRIDPPTAADALKVLTAHVRAERVAS